MTIHNPILRGFNPDPSIVRVANDYYIATSTFEWYPGVQIHHSRDLVNWSINALAATDLPVAPASLVYPLLTTIGAFLGAVHPNFGSPAPRHGVDTYRVVYRTVSAKGKPTTASGAPRTARRAFPASCCGPRGRCRRSPPGGHGRSAA